MLGLPDGPLADQIKGMIEPELFHMPMLSEEELDRGMNAFREQCELRAAELVKTRISELDLSSSKSEGMKEFDESPSDEKSQAGVVVEEKKVLGKEIEDTMQLHRSAPEILWIDEM